ncbi:Mss1p [Sugiyamaella lignohabitans]|uniref:Mss1p n=1 Tax=Sugiyamaella lignohabitans TaxID=796027 RepID=A0A170QYB0_9ASCO|nr:Mss1p [Sugiyamaella lignohabitans]ANB15971.1 Mss1p [Sugiyamaella lignohabitans]
MALRHFEKTVLRWRSCSILSCYNLASSGSLLFSLSEKRASLRTYSKISARSYLEDSVEGSTLGGRHSGNFQVNDGHHPTIYAVSTAPGKAAVAIVRVSGTLAKYVFQRLSRKNEPVPRVAQLNRLYSVFSQKQPEFGKHLGERSENLGVLDHALTLYFEGPNSYTGEDVLELHLHGGTAVVRAVLGQIKLLHSAETPIRYAEAGEFTKRAFHNGRLDLTEVEGIRDIIDAETERQREVAVLTAGGQAKAIYDQWRERIVKNAALLTALIDFADDNAEIESTSQVILEGARSDIKALLQDITAYFSEIQRSELIRSGIKMNFLGPPNAGKSSLLNLIVQRDASIVSDVPGTTRDILEVGMNVDGYKIVFGDTAGIRSLENQVNDSMALIEAEGIRRARKRFQASDVILAVISVESQGQESISDIFKEISEVNKPTVLVVNKMDLAKDADRESIVTFFSETCGLPKNNIVLVSCKSGEGIQDLNEKLSNICKDLTFTSDGSIPLGASQRVQDLLESDVIEGLKNFETSLGNDDVVLALAELHTAVEGIGKITGRGVAVDEILGVVFGNFCIGK